MFPIPTEDQCHTVSSRHLGSPQLDDDGRMYQIIAGSRAKFIDYTMFLDNDEVPLKPFVALIDLSEKRSYFISPKDWIDANEGVLWAPLHVLPGLKTEALQRMCDEFIMKQVSISTIKYFFDGIQRTVGWKRVTLKGVYRDFGE